MVGLSDIKIFLIFSLFLLAAEFLWNGLGLSLSLLLCRLKSLLFGKKFFYYIIWGSVISTVTDRLFSLLVNQAVFREIGGKGGGFPWIMMGVLIFVLMVVHYFLASFLFDLSEKDYIKIALLMGILMAPWPTFFSCL